MKYSSENTIYFEVIDSDTKIPEIINPSHIYKVGDIITYYKLLDEQETVVKKFEVTDVKNELNFWGLVTDQRFIIYLKEIV
jgi:hypothetical protein